MPPGVSAAAAAASSAASPPLSLLDAAMESVTRSFHQHKVSAAPAVSAHAMSDGADADHADAGAAAAGAAASHFADFASQARNAHCLIIDLSRIPLLHPTTANTSSQRCKTRCRRRNA